MRVLLVSPCGVSPTEFPPLGLLYLASSLRQAGHPVDFYDQNHDTRDLETVMEQFGPDLLGISLYTTNVLSAFSLVDRVKTMDRSLPIVVGGPHATALPAETLRQCPGIDYLVAGEGERALVDLVGALERRDEPHQVAGLWYRGGPAQSIVHTRPQVRIENLDELPLPAFDLAERYHYPYDRATRGHKVATIMTSRGCPYNCVFCNKAVFGSRYLRRSPASVAREVEVLAGQYGYDEFYPMDDLFAANRQWLGEFCDQYDRTGLRLDWRCLGRAGTLGRNDYARMRRSRCFQISLGIESGSDRVLRDIRKNVTKEEIRTAVDDIRAAGLQSYGFFIVGHRRETPATAAETFRFAVELNTDFAVFFILVPFPGTEVYRHVPEHLKTQWDRIRYFHSDTLPVSICELSSKQLLEIESQFNSEYYGRWQYLKANVLRGPTPFSKRLAKAKCWAGGLKVRLSRELNGQTAWHN